MNINRVVKHEWPDTPEVTILTDGTKKFIIEAKGMSGISWESESFQGKENVDE